MIKIGGNNEGYWPEDTDTVKYIRDGEYLSLSDLIDMAKEKWGSNIDLSKININSEYIHTDCLTYDEYDPCDYTLFVVMTLNNK